MTLLFTLLTLAVLGVIAAVATGKIAGGLEEPATSLAPRGLPDGPVTPESLDAVRFSPALRGYRMDEVDVVLDRLVSELARRDREFLQFSHELRLAERAYLHRAARGSANPEWITGDAGAIPLIGATPVAGQNPMNGGPGSGSGSGEGSAWSPYSDSGYARPGTGYANQVAPADGTQGQTGGDDGYPGYGQEGQEYPGRVQAPRTDDPGRRDG